MKWRGHSGRQAGDDFSVASEFGRRRLDTATNRLVVKGTPGHTMCSEDEAEQGAALRKHHRGKAERGHPTSATHRCGWSDSEWSCAAAVHRTALRRRFSARQLSAATHGDLTPRPVTRSGVARRRLTRGGSQLWMKRMQCLGTKQSGGRLVQVVETALEAAKAVRAAGGSAV